MFSTQPSTVKLEISLINSKNKVGPKTDPCGTPHVISQNSDVSWWNLTSSKVTKEPFLLGASDTIHFSFLQHNCVIDGIKTFWNIKQTNTCYGTIINILKPIIYNTMKASLCWVSLHISRLVHWNKTVLFQIINNLIPHKRFYHLCNMTDDRYWTLIIFVINVAIILIDRRHSGVLPILLKDTWLKGFINHICQWYRNILGRFFQ